MIEDDKDLEALNCEIARLFWCAFAEVFACDEIDREFYVDGAGDA
jgi:hypothetical protein